MSKPNSSLLNSNHEFMPAETLRETIGSVLVQLNKDWSDVRGVALRIFPGQPSPHVNRETGAVDADRIDEVLDTTSEELWGYKAYTGGEDGVDFNATVWLDDFIVSFSERHSPRDDTHIACDVIPTAPGKAFRYEAPASAPKP